MQALEIDTSGCVLVEDAGEFFAPMASDLVDSLVGEYNAIRVRIHALAAAMNAEQFSCVLHYFVEGNVKEQRHSMPSTVAGLFQVDGAVAQLNAQFWNKALRLTDVLDYMPQKRREEWFEQIRNPLGKKKPRNSWNRNEPDEWEIEALPDFEDDTVRSTLGSLLASRARFLGERVDGIFRSLSRDHVTNQPQGFRKKLIIQGVFGSHTEGVINDLRCVIAKFMGRDEPKHSATGPVIKAASRQNGEWMAVDGGALRIRVYGGVGTAHLQVHPEMAWRLNAILASMHPAAIPAAFRERPKTKKKLKDFELFDRPLPFAVIALLAGMREVSVRIEPSWPERYRSIPMARKFDYGDHDKAVLAEGERVLTAIGGVREKHYWQFDYNPGDVLDQVVCSGCIPDQKSHQFYPTPVNVGEAAIAQAMVDAEPEMSWFEPEAGQGGLADLMPKERTFCIEISPLHCQILKAKGYRVEQADFLKWKPVFGMFDRIAMNPPYSESRWQAHLEHASTMLTRKGRLVAILPASAKGKNLLPGFNLEWSQVYANEFAGPLCQWLF
ncbi:DUF4942 domain-containing protein [Pseudomonas frederiksbergensis]|uniref:DUF4942 domain-containing protein n=1 Tax=Pseudomonas frederiksbergensis TaxID=104087 RepID=UPI000AA66C55|nr:DUF4942 domain-containing protein [Pseudomonas frederiksbergensis]